MEIADFLTPDRVLLDVRARDKGQLITEVGRQFARLVPFLKPETIQAALLAREQLGSTGLGSGFALPHARIDGLGTYLGLFIRLAKPIEFDAIDAKLVHLVFVLLIPSETSTPHVAALAAISRRFRDTGRAPKIVRTRSAAEAFALLTEL